MLSGNDYRGLVRKIVRVRVMKCEGFGLAEFVEVCREGGLYGD